MTDTTVEASNVAKLHLGRVGIWSSSVRFAPDGRESAVELEALGFRTVWVPGGIDSAVLARMDELLDATTHLKIASGILNVWKHDPADVAAWWEGQSIERHSRLLVGLGISHAPLIGEGWDKPVTRMRAFLDGLDAGGMDRDRLCLAALGPKMLELSAERTAGAHPYMVSVRHTAEARRVMGPRPLLAPEQGVVLETDPARARAIAREFVKHYARLPNYANNWRRDGFLDEEIERLDDKLIDDLIAWGDLDAIEARVDAHIAAGADHVCLQVIGPGGMTPNTAYDRDKWRQLARIL